MITFCNGRYSKVRYEDLCPNRDITLIAGKYELLLNSGRIKCISDPSIYSIHAKDCEGWDDFLQELGLSSDGDYEIDLKIPLILDRCGFFVRSDGCKKRFSMRTLFSRSVNTNCNEKEVAEKKFWKLKSGSPFFIIFMLLLTPIRVKACESTSPDIQEEIQFGDMELIAQLVQAEAGNQDLDGKRYVVDVVLNRVDSPIFPNTVEEVIFQDNQFSVIKNGGFDEAGWTITDDCYEAVLLEYGDRLNSDILYFGQKKSKYAKEGCFKYQDHWFGWLWYMIELIILLIISGLFSFAVGNPITGCINIGSGIALLLHYMSDDL